MCSNSSWTPHTELEISSIKTIPLLDVYCSNSSYGHWKHGHSCDLCIGCLDSSWDRTLWIASCISARLGIRFHTVFDTLPQFIKEKVIGKHNIWRRHWCRSPPLPTVLRLCSPQLLWCHPMRAPHAALPLIFSNMLHHGAGAFMVGQLGSGNLYFI